MSARNENDLQDSKSIFIITDFKFFLVILLRFGEFWYIVGLTTIFRLLQRKILIFLYL